MKGRKAGKFIKGSKAAKIAGRKGGRKTAKKSKKR